MTWGKINTDNEPISWKKIQWLHFENNEPYKIFNKETLNENIQFNTMNLAPKNKNG